VTATAGFRTIVSAELDELERRLRTVARGAHPTFAATVAHLFGSPGKMLRPTLVFLSARFGRSYRDAKIVDLAESLELVHTASLVHDDIIDGSLMRRNQPTVNARWGDEVAVIAGDYLFAKAYALAAVLPKPEVISLVAQTVFALCDGELNEISGEPHVPSESEYMERIELKTASLYAACCQGAAMLADADPEIVATLGAFGTNFGLAFQVADDVLDLAGDDETLGKHVGQDLERGMLTLPMIYALDELGPAAGRRFLSAHKTPAETLDLLKAVRDSKGIDRARAKAAHLRDLALAVLEGLPERAERDALAEVTYFATDRDR
jgi:geranylgeranyl pyrophosphate synthase